MTRDMMDHNIMTQQRGRKWDHHDRLLGMWLGFAAFASLIGFAAYAGLTGRPGLAAIFMGTSTIGPIGLFTSAH